MGKNYELNTDGYVDGFGIGREWDWSGEVYLARVDQKRILRYGDWEYFVGPGTDGKPVRSKSQADAKLLTGLFSEDVGSAIYHPGVKRYPFLNSKRLFDAPDPWGPWTVAGDFPPEPPVMTGGKSAGHHDRGPCGRYILVYDGGPSSQAQHDIFISYRPDGDALGLTSPVTTAGRCGMKHTLK